MMILIMVMIMQIILATTTMIMVINGDFMTISKSEFFFRSKPLLQHTRQLSVRISKLYSIIAKGGVANCGVSTWNGNSLTFM